MGTIVTPDAPYGATVQHPLGGRVLLAPLLTEREFSEASGLSPRTVRNHSAIVRVDSPLGVGPAYPAFMLGSDGLRTDLAFVVLLLRRRVTDLEACDWIVRRNPELGNLSPWSWIDEGRSLQRVVRILPDPTRAQPAASPEGDAATIRSEWLQSQGDPHAPGWTASWDRLVRHNAATPHGI